MSILLIISIAIMAVCNWASMGMYNALYTSIYLISALMAIYSLYKYENIDISENICICVSGLFFILTLTKPIWLYNNNQDDASVKALLIIKIMLFMSFCLSILLLIKKFRNRYKNDILYFIYFNVLMANWLVLRAAQLPAIDVFVIDSLGADAFISGKNPYALIYPDIYNGAYGYHPGYPYWPFYLLFSIVPRILGDVRFVTLASLLIVIFAIIRIGRTCNRQSESTSSIILILALPATLFVTEQAWIDTLLFAGIVLAAMFISERKWILSAISMGCVAATKQYGFVALAPTLILWSQLLGYKKAAQLGGVVIITALSFILPFALLDWVSFYHNSIEMLSIMPVRYDSLNLIALIKNAFNLSISSTFLIPMTIIALAIVYVIQIKKNNYMKGWATSVAVSYCTIFCLGKQAFANYHHFAIQLIILVLAMPSIFEYKKTIKIICK